MDISDAFTFIGLGLVTLGVWIVHAPSALIVTGSVLFFMGLLKYLHRK